MTQEQIKQLVERYPFLIPRNVWTGKILENYDYTYMIGWGLPDGWHRLFLQMCEDIRQPLIDADYLEQFRFSQVKEKYNRMCLYNFGAPKAVDEILSKYEMMAGYVCTKCGKPAVYETRDYIASYCEDCWKDMGLAEKAKVIEFKPYYKRTNWGTGGKLSEIISFEEEWNRYLKGLEGENV